MDSGHLHIGGRKWRDVKRPRREDPGSDSGCCQPRHRPRRAPGTVADRIITFAEIVGQENVIARHRLRPRRPRPSANRLGQAPRPGRRHSDREQEVVELNSKVPVRDERNQKRESSESKV
jgi:hypothetical protein